MSWKPERTTVLLAVCTLAVASVSQWIAGVEHGTFEGQVPWLLSTLVVLTIWIGGR